MIYFIHCAAIEAVKIGYTSGKATDRLKSLQTGCPHPLKLMLVVAGEFKDELALHAKFSHLRMQGEWFRESPELMDEIRRHGSGFHPIREAIDPDGLPVANGDDFMSFVENGGMYPALCYLASMAVGHAVQIYWGAGAMFGLSTDVYQVMREDEGPGPGHAFWRHHLDRPQWFNNPEEACAAYVASYYEWRKGGGES